MVAQNKLQVMTLLTELQDELQQLGWWQQHAPSEQALQSQQPFCVDTLEFAQWLQWIFIARMQTMVMTDQALPRQCAIYEMAEVVYRDQLALTTSLLSCLKRIDTAVMASAVLH
ncbi:MAG: YqcC family protein [Pseudomonas sp.]|jgi:uncharacterized protein YqcC (DUF446 family)|nr:YqcC family protein [Pseudomonas sp.]